MSNSLPWTTEQVRYQAAVYDQGVRSASGRGVVVSYEAHLLPRGNWGTAVEIEDSPHEPPQWYGIGEAGTAENAKAIAERHWAKLSRKKNPKKRSRKPDAKAILRRAMRGT